MSTLQSVTPPGGGSAPPAARRAWAVVRGWRPGVVVAALVLAFFVVAAIAPSLVTTQSPTKLDLTAVLQPPSADHLFGTDQNGRDLYTRIVFGIRQSLLIALGATAIGIGVAVVLGFVSGLSNRYVDGAINRVLEVLFAFPVLVLALLLAAALGGGPTTQVIAIGVGSAPGYARMIRGQVLLVRGRPFVEAAGALGHPYAAVVRRHIFPNAMRPLVVVVTLGLGQSIVWASALAFLGLGVQPPSSELGALLKAGRDYVERAWWLEIIPGLAIVALALAITAIGRALQRRLEGATA